MTKTILSTALLLLTFLISYSQCEIWELRFDLDNCDADGRVGIVINFNHMNTSDSFEVKGNGHNYGTFAYADLPVFIGRVEGDCTTPYELVVRDQVELSCAEDIGIGTICCECRIYDIVMDVSDCNRRGEFFVHIDFQHEGTGDEFTVKGNGNNYGTFLYNQLPIRIGPLEGDCRTEYEFVIQDVDHPDCAGDIVLGEVCCNCDIFDFHVEALECIGDSCMVITLDFEHQGTGTTGFTVYDHNGMPFGTYQYSQLPLIIDCWPVTGRSVDRIGVCDNQYPDCCADREFETLGCDSCIIDGLRSEAIECDTNKSFYILTNFQFHMPGDSGYCLSINDSLFGPFSYDTTERVIGPFQGGCDSLYEIIAFDKEYAECGDTSYIEDPCCEKCHLFDLRAEAIECNGDSCLVVVLDFEFGSVHGSEFQVYGRNGLIGTYPYSSLPLTIDCFPHHGARL